MECLDHVALLVRSIAPAARPIAALGHACSAPEEFPSEGTREMYVARSRPGSVLLVEPLGAGPYARALLKRGPGLHHIAFSVADLDLYLAALGGSGWFLLPQSLASIRKTSTAWLARPGVGALIEVVQGTGGALVKDACVSRVEIPCQGDAAALLSSLGVTGVMQSPDEQAWLTLGGRRLSCSELSLATGSPIAPTDALDA